MNKGVDINGVCLNTGHFVFAVPESTHVSEPLLPCHSFEHSVYPNIFNLASRVGFYFVNYFWLCDLKLIELKTKLSRRFKISGQPCVHVSMQT